MAVTVAAPVAGLPAGPATEATVKANLSIPIGHTADDERLELTINAVNQMVTTWSVVTSWLATLADPIPPETVWPESIVLGCTLLASRWFRRGNSPAGVIDLGGESGVAYVQRNDPDIGLMLGLGPYRKPQVG